MNDRLTGGEGYKVTEKQGDRMAGSQSDRQKG